jgi:hypothetical protein
MRACEKEAVTLFRNLVANENRDYKYIKNSKNCIEFLFILVIKKAG